MVWIASSARADKSIAFEKEASEYIEWQKNPFRFIQAMWNLVPTNRGDPFIKWRHLTWQQSQIIEAVRKAVNNEWPKKISVRSWHGVGKSAVMAMLILRFLFCFMDSQVPCTAPTKTQMYDVLRKEIAVWLDRMPEEFQQLYEKSRDYIRMVERKDIWFARARTADKENPEAIAGIHAENVAIFVDEASWVADEVFEVAKGALTSANVLLIMISNPTRITWYFYRSHNLLKDSFKTFNFSCLDSPIVDHAFVQEIITEYWLGSNEYRVRVLGEFPDEDAIDDEWYVRMLKQFDLRYTNDVDFNKQDLVLGIDPAWEWDDQTVRVLRDSFKARILRKENVSTPKGIASITATIMTEWKIPWDRVIVDNFGVGADCIQELALAWYRVYWLYLGKTAANKNEFLNKRAELYWRLRERIRKGGELVRWDWRDELLNIYYKRDLSNHIQIMDKLKMRNKLGIKSPNVADSLMLTFAVPGIWDNMSPTMTPNFGLDPRQTPVITNFTDLI